MKVIATAQSKDEIKHKVVTTVTLLINMNR